MSLLHPPNNDTPVTGAVPLGSDFVVDDEAGYRSIFQMTVLPNGNVVYVWAQDDAPGDDVYQGILMKIFDADGNVVQGATLVNTTTESGQHNPVVEVTGSGFVVVWEDNSTSIGGNYSEIAAQMYDFDGNTVNGEFRIENTVFDFAEYQDVTGLKGGGFAITFTGGFINSSTPAQVWLQLYDAAGAEIGELIEIDDDPGLFQSNPVITELEGGGFAVAFEEFFGDEADNGYGVRVRTFDKDGNPVTDSIIAPDIVDSGQLQPSIDALTGGGFVVVWNDSNAEAGLNPPGRAFAQMFDANGAQVGSDILIYLGETGTGAENLSVVATPEGGFAVLYYEYETSELLEGSVFVQEYDSDGNTLGNVLEFANDTGLQWRAIEAHSTADGFVIVYTEGDGFSGTVRSQFFETGKFSADTPGDVIDGDNDGNILTGTDGDDVINGLGGWDRIYGGEGDDSIFGGGETDRLYGEAGDDYINGNNERDILFGGDGNDTLRGGEGDDVLKGGAGNDRLVGDAGNDHLQGGAGADVLKGGEGRDILNGGAGADTFVYGAVSDSPADADFRDTIQDFESGVDQINLQGIDAIAATSANDAFVMVTSFSGAGGELTVKATSQDGVFWLRGDTDGDGHADFEVIVKGDMPTADDILL